MICLHNENKIQKKNYNQVRKTQLEIITQHLLDNTYNKNFTTSQVIKYLKMQKIFLKKYKGISKKNIKKNGNLVTYSNELIEESSSR